MTPTGPDDLYALPLDRFTAERDALASRLREEGKREEAASVKKLRKPNPAAWAVNLLVRGEQSMVKELLDATDELRRAQRRLLGGAGDRQRLRDVLAARDEAAAHLTDRAAQLLKDAGFAANRSQLEAVSLTLRALATDDEGRQAFESGVLSAPLTPSGFGELEAISAVPDEPVHRSTDAERRRAELVAQRDAAAERAAEASRRWMKANEEAQTLQRRAREAAERAEDLRAQAESAAQRAEDARAEAAEARRLTEERESDLASLES